jgi:hypothetical protein
MNTPVSFADFPKDMSLGWISSESPNITIMNFFRADMQAAKMQEIYAFLHHAVIEEIDIVCDPGLPDLNAVIEEKLPEKNVPETLRGPGYSVRLVYDRGSISFLYMDVAFLATERKVVMQMDRK